jgi:hypothetical protein
VALVKTSSDVFTKYAVDTNQFPEQDGSFPKTWEQLSGKPALAEVTTWGVFYGSISGCLQYSLYYLSTARKIR